MNGTHSAHGTETTAPSDLAGVGLSAREEMMYQGNRTTLQLSAYENSRHCVTQDGPAQEASKGVGGRSVAAKW